MKKTCIEDIPVMTRVMENMTGVIFIYVSDRNKGIGGKMLFLPCEVAVQTVLPAIRSLMARTILEKHGMKEKQVADILGLSQSAISRYTTKDRGNIVTLENVPEVLTLIDRMIHLLLYEKLNQNTEVLELICQTCKTIREKGLMCELCQKKTKDKLIEICTFCQST